MRRLALGLTLFVFGTGVALAVTNTAKLVGPKYTLKEVMGKAHKEGLLKKVTAGDASAEEKAQLLDLYVAMYDHEAPKGDAGSWTEKTSAAVLRDCVFSKAFWHDMLWVVVHQSGGQFTRRHRPDPARSPHPASDSTVPVYPATPPFQTLDTLLPPEDGFSQITPDLWARVAGSLVVGPQLLVVVRLVRTAASDAKFPSNSD